MILSHKDYKILAGYRCSKCGRIEVYALQNIEDLPSVYGPLNRKFIDASRDGKRMLCYECFYHRKMLRCVEAELNEKLSVFEKVPEEYFDERGDY